MISAQHMPEETPDEQPEGAGKLHIVPLAGRRRELQQVLDHLNGWIANSGTPDQQPEQTSLLLLSGKPGVGKSRLATEALRRLREDSKATSVAIHLQGTGGALGPALALLRELPEEARRCLPDGFSYDSLQPGHGEGPLAQMAPASAGQLLAQVAADALMLRSAGQPLILLVEDLHLASQSAAMLVEITARLKSRCSLMLLATVRSGEDVPRELQSEFSIKVIELAPLGREGGAELLALAAPGLQLGEAALARLDRATRGLPLLYMHLGALSQELIEELLPEMEQIADENADEALRLLLTRAYADDKELIERLSSTHLDGMFSAASPSPHGRKSASQGLLGHAMVLEAAYGLLPPERRRALQQRALDLLLPQLHGGSALEWELLPLCCYLLEELGQNIELHKRCCDMLMLMLQSGRRERWDEWLVRAEAAWQGAENSVLRGPAASESPYLARVMGTECWQGGDVEGALRIFERAIEVVAESDMIFKGRLEVDLGNCYIMQSRFKEAQNCFERAEQHLQNQGSSLCAVISGQGIVRHREGNFGEARTLYENAFALASAEGSLSHQASYLNFLATLHLDLRQTDLSVSYFQQALGILSRVYDLPRKASVLVNLGNAHVVNEDWKQAEECLREAIKCARQARSRRIEESARLSLAVMLLRRREFANARVLFEEVLLQLSPDDNVTRGYALQCYGELLLQIDKPLEAAEMLDCSAELLENAGTLLWLGVALCIRVEVFAYNGDKVAAQKLLERCEQIYKDIGSPQDADFWPALEKARRACQ